MTKPMRPSLTNLPITKSFEEIFDLYEIFMKATHVMKRSSTKLYIFSPDIWECNILMSVILVNILRHECMLDMYKFLGNRLVHFLFYWVKLQDIML